MRGLRLLVWLGAGLALQAQTVILPLSGIKAGMKGTGRTVFSAGQVEEFQAEILGIIENMGPRQSVILARLTGGPLEKTGVMQGMSGSPVYIDGKLIGAVALAFPFSKDPIAGIRPIEEMLNLRGPQAPARASLPKPDIQNLATLLPKAVEVSAGGTQLAEMATPLWFSGFTRATLDQFSGALKASGLEPVQGIGGGGNPTAASASAKLEPGSMISVQLMTGDLAVGADGTVTHIDGNKIYAFGHRFLSAGDTEMPFARAEVLTLLASQNQSFKISSPKEWMGTILQDRSTAVAGELGRKTRLSPVTLKLRNRAAGTETSYRMEMVNDRLLSPVLLQMAVYSALDATERVFGAASVGLRGTLEWNSGPPVRIDNVVSGEFGVPQQISAAAAVPLAYALQSNFDSLQLKRVDLELEVSDQKQSWQIDSVTASPLEVRPGETVTVEVGFTGPNGAEASASARYRVPIGSPLGPLNLTAADALTSNLTDYRQFFTAPPRSVDQLVGYLNGLKPNNKAFLRVWRGYPSYQVQGETLPSPPPSFALLQRGRGAHPVSNLEEMELQAPVGAISGNRTIQVEVKE